MQVMTTLLLQDTVCLAAGRLFCKFCVKCTNIACALRAFKFELMQGLPASVQTLDGIVVRVACFDSIWVGLCVGRPTTATSQFKMKPANVTLNVLCADLTEAKK